MNRLELLKQKALEIEKWVPGQNILEAGEMVLVRITIRQASKVMLSEVGGARYQSINCRFREAGLPYRLKGFPRGADADKQEVKIVHLR